MRKLRLFMILGVLVVAAVATAAASAAQPGVSGKATIEPTVVPDSSLHPRSTTVGGATVLPTTRTVTHWFGQTLDPNNGVTYGYNMVGADPNSCTSSGCTVHVTADITPINVVIDGLTFSGSDVLGPTLASPQFAQNDYGSTTAATNESGGQGPGGALSQDDAGNQLQLEDATMRAQFNKTGSSSYHLILDPVPHPAITLVVPQHQGTLLQSGRGVIFGDVDIGWWSSQIKNLDEKYADPTHFPIWLTNSVMLYDGNDPGNCCVIGYHGTSPVGFGGGSGNSNGNAKVQTFAWASYVQPGIFNPNLDWALQDIHAISHEIAEWGDDPFVNNLVEPWLTPTAPQYGCTSVLETGDPVVGIGFSKGTNTWAQGANPNGSQSADGTYHPEDEVFLPWFMRSAPNTISEPTQSPSANVGRYTLMGDLNPFPGFRQPATGC
jgi:hypothetical protein